MCAATMPFVCCFYALPTIGVPSEFVDDLMYPLYQWYHVDIPRLNDVHAWTKTHVVVRASAGILRIDVTPVSDQGSRALERFQGNEEIKISPVFDIIVGGAWPAGRRCDIYHGNQQQLQKGLDRDDEDDEDETTHKEREKLRTTHNSAVIRTIIFFV